MKSKLNLDPKVVDSARQHAANIAHDMQEFIERHTTVSTERTIVRLLGVDGVDDVDTPLPNVVVDQLKEAGALPTGAAYWIGNAIVQTGKTPQEIAEEMAEGKLDITKLPTCSKEEASEALKPSIKATFERIDMQKAKREEYLKTIGEGCGQTGSRHHSSYQNYCSVSSGLRSLRTYHRGIRRYICYSGKLQDHEKSPRRGGRRSRKIYQTLQLLIGNVHA